MFYHTIIIAFYIPKDENGRNKNIQFNEITITGESLLYPNPVFMIQNKIKCICTYKEGVMSLKGGKKIKKSD